MQEEDAAESRVSWETIRKEGKCLVLQPFGPREPSRGACCSGAHQSGRNDSLAHTLWALADANREWTSRRSPLGTVALRRPLAPRGGARSSAQSRWRLPPDGCSRADSHSWLNTASSGEAVARYPSGSLGREGALLNRPKPGLSAPTSPSPQRLGGAPGSPRPAPIGLQSLGKAPTLLPLGSLPFPLTTLVLSRSVRAEIGSPLNSGEKCRCKHIRTKPTPRCVCGY